MYLETLLDEYDQQIQDTIREYGMGDSSAKSAAQAKMYIDFIKLRLKLCCQLRPERVFGVVEKMTKSRKGAEGRAYFPIEECLAICTEHN